MKLAHCLSAVAKLLVFFIVVLAELLKNAGSDGIKWLTAIFQSVWRSGNIPDDWRRGIILPLYKARVVDVTDAITQEFHFCLFQARHLRVFCCRWLRTSCSIIGGSNRAILHQAGVQ